MSSVGQRDTSSSGRGLQLVATTLLVALLHVWVRTASAQENADGPTNAPLPDDVTAQDDSSAPVDAEPSAGEPQPVHEPAAQPTAASVGEPVAASEGAKPEQTFDIMLLDLDRLLSVDISAASKLGERAAEAPGIVSVVTQKEIDAYGWLSLNDILYRQPGFIPARDYDRRTVAARGQFEGWNNNHLLLMIDGVPFNDNLYGSAYTWEITPLYFTDRVEIVRGPGSALYGGNATNGVLNLKTLQLGPNQTIGKARVRVGNANTQIYDVLSGHSNRDYSLVMSYTHYGTSGEQYRTPDGSGRLDSAGALAKFKLQDGRSSDYVFAKLESRRLLEGLALQYHYQAWDFETGHGWLWYIPDFRESMKESRQLAALSYHATTGDLAHEYVLRYQKHSIDWNTRYYPNGTAFGSGDDAIIYPGGLTEYLRTDGEDIFARTQWTLSLPFQATVLGGVEYDMFLYTGDDGHFSNVPLAGSPNPPDGIVQPLGPWFEWVENRPVSTLGTYLQGVSGKLLTDRLTLTAGARYDIMFFEYRDLNDAGRADRNKSFQQFTPRAVLVFRALDTLHFKALAGRGFRAPAPSELFGANTYSLASNLSQLKPETITTFEFAGDWKAARGLTLRSNIYYRDFNNQIAYSVANNNLSTNVYSNQTIGVESEVLAEVPLGKSAGTLGGFANHSFAHLVDEEIQDTTIAQRDVLTWVPAHVANLGLRYQRAWLLASLQGHFQGGVNRRSSDRQIPDYLTYRGSDVNPWVTVDARVAVQPEPWVKLGIQGTNLFNARAPLVKNNDYPFDYRSDGLRILGTLELQFERTPESELDG